MSNTNDRFVRWQGILRDQVSFLNNLLITISILLFGFINVSLNSTIFNPKGVEKLFLSSGFILIVFSLLLGIIASISRLTDFRLTLRKINTKTDKDEIPDIKTLMDLYGKTTWRLLIGQIITFTLGVISLAIALLSIQSCKFF